MIQRSQMVKMIDPFGPLCILLDPFEPLGCTSRIIDQLVDESAKLAVRQNQRRISGLTDDHVLYIIIVCEI